MIDNHLTLSDLNSKIRDAVDDAFPEALWVIAEILEMQVNRSGHCYMELIEKSTGDNTILAKSRATIWASRYNMLRSYFETSTRTKLEPGIKLLLKANVSFHPIYGLSLNISDIDPKFTIGDMAMKKQEVINKLIASGVIEMNKELVLSDLPKRIAIISSETAAGYGDFIDSLLNNTYGYKFQVSLFPALVQGNAAVASIISAMEQIFNMDAEFDTVVIIRGGGSQADLDCFNDYDLAFNIAQFPLPILTGIGHERDETVSDIVAFKSLKTPTAVAEYLIDRVFIFDEYVQALQNRFEQNIKWIIQNNRMYLQSKASDLNHLVKQYITNGNHDLNAFGNTLNKILIQRFQNEKNNIRNSSGRLKYLWRGLFERENRQQLFLNDKSRRVFIDSIKQSKQRLEGFEKTLQLLSPEKVLARGYSITSSEGKILKSTEGLKNGSKLHTKLSGGSIESTVNKLNK